MKLWFLIIGQSTNDWIEILRKPSLDKLRDVLWRGNEKITCDYIFNQNTVQEYSDNKKNALKWAIINKKKQYRYQRKKIP